MLTTTPRVNVHRNFACRNGQGEYKTTNLYNNRSHRDCFPYHRRLLEGQARDEHLLDERRRRHQVLQLQVEDALQALHAQGAQLRQLAQQPAEVVGLALGLRVVGHVVAERGDYLHLELLHLVGLLQTVALWKRKAHPAGDCGFGGSYQKLSRTSSAL